MTVPDHGKLDPAQVAALFVQHGEELRRFLVGVLRHHERANDVLQTTFAKAIESGHTAQTESLRGWLFRVAFNEAIALRRKLAVQAKAAERIAAQGAPQGETPDASLVRWELVQQVRQALTHLPEPQRQVVEMRIYQQKPFAQIAAELGVPLGTVLSRMHAALKKLRHLIDR